MRDNSTETPHALDVTPARPKSVLVLLSLVAAAAIFYLIHRARLGEFLLVDVPVYRHAFTVWISGRSPYNADLSPFFFLYPPVFLYIAAAFWHILPAHWGPYMYGLAHVAATLALPLVLARYFFRSRWLGPLFAMLVFFASPRFVGIQTFLEFNIASILYVLAFIVAIPGLKKNRWQWFYLAVLFAAMIKITFLALLILPVLAGRKQWGRSIVCAIAVVAVNLLQLQFLPQLYNGYQWSLQQGIAAQQHFGYGVFGIAATYHYKQRNGIGVAAYVISLAVSFTILGLMLAMRQKLQRTGNFGPDSTLWSYWLAFVVMTIVLVNPREMQYDMDIALFAAFGLWVYVLRTRRLLVLLAALLLPSLLVPLVVLNEQMQGIYETLLVLMIFALANHRLWRDAGKLSNDNRRQEPRGNGAPAESVLSERFEPSSR
jgi:hypothetical protein